jgi:Tfp pilus assembly protein PilX
MHLIAAEKRARLLAEESGFSMAPVLIALFLISMLVATSLTAARGDLNLTRNDQDQKQAYEAALAGINDYQYHLNSDTNYWTNCTSVPTPNAVNLQGTTTNRLTVPGGTGATYSIELLHASTSPAGANCSAANPNGTMLESATSSAPGTFRIRSTGYANGSQSSIVATFKRRSFLDYVYFTQLETSDPVTYDDPTTIAGAYQQCTKKMGPIWANGRYGAAIPGTNGQTYCDIIQFAAGDDVNGPMHTNDAIVTCGSPDFGRTTADRIEIGTPVSFNADGSAASPYVPICGAAVPNWKGTLKTPASDLEPPPTNQSLATIAANNYQFEGETTITLGTSTLSVTSGGTTQSGLAYPANGVIYVSNSSTGACSTSYSPFTAALKSSTADDACGNVYVSGSYTGQKLTIASENDVIIESNITRTTGGTGVLGLIANNFVRVYRPYPTQTARNSCGTGTGASANSNLQIDAAILAIQHSFIVDHYNCGSPLGTLTVNGAISQKFRGAVGTGGSSSSTGYLKSYNYDDRLSYFSPPFFIEPVEASWTVQRETLDFP